MSPETGKIDTPELYLYMHRKFKDTFPEAVESAEEEQNKEQEESEGRASKAKDKPRYEGYALGARDIPEPLGDNPFSFSIKSSLECLVNMVSDLSNGRAGNIRDNLYVTAYIMNMFSYATFENEGYYGLLEDETKKELKLEGQYDKEYKELYQQKKGPAEEEGTWLSTDPKDSYNKTLTNRLINVDNNVAYLAEVEYILYGQTNEVSVKKAYGDIYEIRYVLNLVSAFDNFWSGNNNTSKAINGVAKAVAGLTAGIIPAALTKVILLPILSVFETCKDLDRLEAGFPVELYKRPDDWWYGFDSPEDDAKEDGYWENKGVSAFVSALKSLGSRNNPDKGLQYSDYLTLLVYLGLSGNEKTAEKIYLRMGDVIQVNMQNATGNEEYTLEKTQF